MTKGDKVEYSSRIPGLMAQNFFIWLLPGLVIFSLSVIILVVLASAAATGFDGDPLKKAPKGLLSFLGPAYILAAITLGIIAMVYSGTDIQGMILMIAVAVCLLILGYFAIRYEIKRLKEYCLKHPQ